MAEPALPPPASGPEAPRGLVAELSNFAGSLGRHLESLFTLAGLEAREAAGIYLRIAIVLAAALLFLLLGYILTLFFVAYLMVAVLHFDGLWVSLGFAVFHLASAALCAWYVKSNFSAPVFAATSQELKKDFDALKGMKS